MKAQRPWEPGPLQRGRPTYVALADTIAADVARGRLRPGDRLPTHRALARTLGVTVGTVARAYAEAEQRGLVSGEVGRGTFVRTGFGVAAAPDALADLASLHPPIAEGVDPTGLLGATLAALATDPQALRAIAETEQSADAVAHRAAAASWVAHGDFAPAPEQILLTSGAQHAVVIALLALVPAGSAVATTALTNPGLVAAARQLGVRLVVVDSDDDGMVPSALEARCAEGPVAAVHVQPTLGNPVGRVMPAQRREELAGVCDRAGLWILEDDPLAPLVPERPLALAAMLPGRTCHMASAAKVLALGLRVGVLTAPETARPQLAAALRSTTWLAAPLLGEILSRWVQDGTAATLVAARVKATRQRNAAARQLLGPDSVVADPASPHLWVPLPQPWSSGAFVHAAREAGVLVSPGDDYVTDRRDPGFGVRIGLNAELGDDALRDALLSVVAVLASDPSPSALS
jgi:DNA-binding transcriptional MocR family regulator